MDKKRAIELIKSQVLGCLDPNTEQELRVYAESGEDFPFEELGQYQNLSALLPLNLTLESPGIEVKNKVAQKLYELKAELESSETVEEEIIIEEPVSDEFVSDENSITEDITVEEDVKIEEEVKIVEPVHQELIQKEKIQPQFEEIKRDKKIKDVLDKEDFEKRTKEYISTYYDSVIKDLNSQSKKTLLISIIASIIALISIVLHFVL